MGEETFILPKGVIGANGTDALRVKFGLAVESVRTMDFFLPAFTELSLVSRRLTEPFESSSFIFFCLDFFLVDDCFLFGDQDDVSVSLLTGSRDF